MAQSVLINDKKDWFGSSGHGLQETEWDLSPFFSPGCLLYSQRHLSESFVPTEPYSAGLGVNVDLLLSFKQL